MAPIDELAPDDALGFDSKLFGLNRIYGPVKLSVHFNNVLSV